MRSSSTIEAGMRRIRPIAQGGIGRALVLTLFFTAAAPPAGAAAEELVIGYLALKKDPRYTRKRTYARFLTQALGSPYPASQGRDRGIPIRGFGRAASNSRSSATG